METDKGADASNDSRITGQNTGASAPGAGEHVVKSEHARNVEKAIADFRPGQVTDISPPPRIQAVEPIRRFFDYSHLPAHLQYISAPFSVLADDILKLPASAERSVALRKLLEAKDATVRAALPG